MYMDGKKMVKNMLKKIILKQEFFSYKFDKYTLYKLTQILGKNKKQTKS